MQIQQKTDVATISDTHGADSVHPSCLFLYENNEKLPILFNAQIICYPR